MGTRLCVSNLPLSETEEALTLVSVYLALASTPREP